MNVWNSNELNKFFNSVDSKIYGKLADASGVSFDSRTIKCDEIFFALVGENFDGHCYVHECFSKGSLAAIVQNDDEWDTMLSQFPGKFVVVVKSTYDTLLKLAEHRRKCLRSTIIAITGSVGKTTSKLGLEHFFRKIGKDVFCAPKNYNNMLGVAYLLVNTPMNTEFLIVELGTNNFGEIEQLAKLVQPHYSLITHIGPAHIEYFKTLYNTALEKGSLFKYTKVHGFFNQDFWYAELFEKICRESHLSFSSFRNGNNVLNTMKNSWKLLFDILELPFLDDEEFGYNVPGRKDVFKVFYNESVIDVIDSSYNANLSSMLDAIKFLHEVSEKSGTSKIAVLGDMKEIGDRARRYHEVLACYLQDVQVFLIGDNMRYLKAKMKNSFWFYNIDDLQKSLFEYLKNDAVVLIKSSGNHLSRVIESFKKLK